MSMQHGHENGLSSKDDGLQKSEVDCIQRRVACRARWSHDRIHILISNEAQDKFKKFHRTTLIISGHNLKFEARLMQKPEKKWKKRRFEGFPEPGKLLLN